MAPTRLTHGFVACLVLAAVLCAAPLAAAGTPSKLTLVDAPTLVVDPAANASDGGSVVLQFLNDGPAKVTLALTASEGANDAGKRSGGSVALQTVADLAGKTAKEITEVDPSQFLYVRADVRNVLQDGSWDIEIRNHGVKIGVFKVIRSPISFNVKLDAPNPDAAEISLQRGVPKLLSFVNADDRAYPVSWELAIDGQKETAVGPRPRADKTLADSGPMLPAKGTGQVLFTPPCAWFSSNGVLHDQTADGRLTIRLRRMDCAGPGCEPSPDAPSKIFKVKVHLAYCSPGWRAFWTDLSSLGGDLLIFVALLCGAGVSFAVNLVFPNYVSRRNFRRQLSETEGRIASLPTALSSRLRVLAGIERKSLQDGLGQVGYISLDFKGWIAGVEQTANLLSKRVDLLQQMGIDRVRFEAVRAQASPPTLVDAIEDIFEEVIRNLDSVGIGDKALADATVKVADIEKRMEDLRKAGPDFARQLTDRAKWLTAEFTDAPEHPVGHSATCGRLRAALPGLFDQLAVAPSDPNTLMPDDYAKWDMVLYKLNLMRRYVNWREAGQREDRANQFNAIEGELVKRLLLFNWEGLNLARRYVREMEQNIFADELAAQIHAGRVQIRRDRFAVRQSMPAQYYLEFDDPAYNTAEARQDFTCTWFFDHGSGKSATVELMRKTAMQEEGWVASHYFPEPGVHHVWVNFHRQEAGFPDIALAPVEVPVEAVRPRDNKWNQRWIELVQVLLAILPAMLGLVAGAKDQLAKLDLIPAAIAIFAIGFGSDQIKNKLTGSSSSSGSS